MTPEPRVLYFDDRKNAWVLIINQHNGQAWVSRHVRLDGPKLLPTDRAAAEERARQD